MSKTKKVWLPIIIVAAIAAFIVMVALVASAFSDEDPKAELKETDTPDTAESAEPEETISPEMQALMDKLGITEEDIKQAENKKSSDTKKSTEKKESSDKKQTGTQQSSQPSSTGKQSQSQGRTDVNNKEQGDGPITNIIGALQGAAESTGDFIGTMKDISRAYEHGDVVGIITSPADFANGVQTFFETVFDGANGQDDDTEK